MHYASSRIVFDTSCTLENAQVGITAVPLQIWKFYRKCHNLRDAGMYLKHHCQSLDCKQSDITRRKGYMHLELYYAAGRWEYPSPVDPSQPPSENEAAFASSEILRSSSDSSRSSSSSAAERRDSTDFGTLMESVCGSCPNSAQGSHAEAAAEAGEAQQDSRNSRTSLPEAHTSAAAAGAGGASSTAVADSGNISTTAAAGSDAVSAMAAGADASAATAAATGAERAHHGMEATAGIHTLSTMKDTSYASPLDGSLPPNAQETSRDIENAASEPGDAMTAVPAVAGHDSLASSADSCATSADDHQASDPGGSASVDSKQAESPICRADGEFATTAAPEPSSRRAELSSKATEPSSQVAESASKSSTTPPKPPKGGSPKKGGLVNVQRPAVKGYSIHRSAFYSL